LLPANQTGLTSANSKHEIEHSLIRLRFQHANRGAGQESHKFSRYNWRNIPITLIMALRWALE